MRILQAKILEWVAMPSSRGSSQPRDQTQVSCIAGGFSTIWVTREAPSNLWLLLSLLLFLHPCGLLSLLFGSNYDHFLMVLTYFQLLPGFIFVNNSFSLSQMSMWVYFPSWSIFFSNYFLGDLVSSYNVSSLSKPMSPPLSKCWWSLKQVYLLLYQSNLLFFFCPLGMFFFFIYFY